MSNNCGRAYIDQQRPAPIQMMTNDPPVKSYTSQIAPQISSKFGMVIVISVDRDAGDIMDVQDEVWEQL